MSLAIGSGITAALASVFAKLASQNLPAQNLAYYSLCIILNPNCEVESASRDSVYLHYASWLRFIFLIFVFVSNGLMWLQFTTALSNSSSSLKVTTLNTAANMGTTGLLSFLVFYEPLPGKWWVGSLFIVIGSLLMNYGDAIKQKHD